MSAVYLPHPPPPPHPLLDHRTKLSSCGGVVIAIKWENRSCEWTACRVVIGGKSIEFPLGISGEQKCLRPVQFIFVTQISVIRSLKYDGKFEMDRGGSRYLRFWHVLFYLERHCYLIVPIFCFQLTLLCGYLGTLN
jgi:hypothetical protein